jgi:hypothetical protein
MQSSDRHEYPTIKGKHLFALVGGIGLSVILAFVVWRETSHVVARSAHENLRIEVREFRDDPFPWNILHGDNGLFHYRCEIFDPRGDVSGFSYFRGNSDGRAQNVVTRWESPNQVSVTFDNGIVIECSFSVNSKAGWSLK